MKNYGFTFQYRETENADPVTERFFITSRDNDAENACTIAMLQFIKRRGYFSARLLKVITF